jgi:DNA-directed RNA polymerase II subunit RPB2
LELLDVEEQDGITIAMTTKELNDAMISRELNAPEELNNPIIRYTHCEIHPCLMYGEIVGSIPYSRHNPSPRLNFQGCTSVCLTSSGNMGKQGMGAPSLDYLNRMDTMIHILHYMQKPITYTKTSRLTGIDDLPAGFEAVVMIACLDGFVEFLHI